MFTAARQIAFQCKSVRQAVAALRQAGVPTFAAATALAERFGLSNAAVAQALEGWAEE